MTEREIFAAALHHRNAAERAAFLDAACGGDTALRQRLESLLAEHEQLGSFMEVPTSKITIEQPPIERIGTMVGPYKLLQQIGEGGFGAVYMAEQLEPVRRKVALKVIKPGMDTHQVIARFEAERQALAVMDHPNIARVFDAGATESGRPYFVMELVRGVPITQYCDENQLPIRERLELFATVGQAIQHAHTKGIIHRDIKPTNVLVTRHDGQPVVKVIDFGVAKAMGQQLTEKTLFTEFAQMIGTPLYMSPEQAELSGVDIDTRSDIYSLGVLLYELLTGSTPVSKEQLKQAAFDEIRRIIREEEPPKPSTRISTAEAAPSIAAQRHTEPAKLARLVRGELDWIAMKALEKDRNRRYETASGFAADVLHHLRDEPVLACPPSAGYRLCKFMRRNQAVLATAAIVAAALVLGIAVSTSQAIRASKAENLANGLLVSEKRATAKEAAARNEAEKNLGKARQAVKQMLTRVAEERLAYVPQMEDVRRELFEDALRFYEELLKQADVDPEIQLEASLAHLRVGNMARVLGRHQEAEEHCRAALTIMERLCRDQPESEQCQLVLSDAYQGLGEALATGSAGPRTAEAEQALNSSILLRGNLAVRSPIDANHRQRQSVSYRWLALALARDASRRQDAADACGAAIEISQRLVSEHPSSPDYLAGLASAHFTLSTILEKLEQPAAAREHLQTAVTTFERLESASAAPASLSRELGTTHQGLAAYRHDFASACCRLGDWLAKDGDHQGSAATFTKGLAIYERLVADFPSVPLYRKNLATNLTKWSALLQASGDAVAAEAATRRVIDLQRESIALAENSVSQSGGAPAALRQLGDRLNTLGWMLQERFRMAEAAESFRQCVDVQTRLVAARGAVPDDRLRLEWAYTSLGYALKLGGRIDEAIAVQCQALPLAETLAAEFPQERKYADRPAVSHWRLGDLLRATGRLDEAQAHYQQAVDFYEANAEPHDFRDARSSALLGLAQIWSQRGRSEQAAKTYEQLLQLKPVSAYDHYHFAYLLTTCEELKFRDPQRAVEFATKSVELEPQDRIYWLVLGVAQYRAGDWKAAALALEKSTALDEGGNAYASFFLAMAHWQLDYKEEARRWLDQGVTWMDQNAKDNLDLRRFRAEAEELMKESGVGDQESDGKTQIDSWLLKQKRPVRP